MLAKISLRDLGQVDGFRGFVHNRYRRDILFGTARRRYFVYHDGCFRRRDTLCQPGQRAALLTPQTHVTRLCTRRCGACTSSH